ncbi:MAG: polyketide cyclase, partial [Deltaproteobacteria bacterium]|nr:polyketide cyclase [Deltaproteobacteria bacterium]
MYFFDAARGRRRRVRVGDLLDHVRSSKLDLLGKAYRDGSNRARGLVERLRHHPDELAPDAVVEGRVRAQLGRVV